MNNILANVRQVFFLDACHMKSVWRGTIYMAVVKSVMDEKIPVAMSIQRDNECNNGWEIGRAHV